MIPLGRVLHTLENYTNSQNLKDATRHLSAAELCCDTLSTARKPLFVSYIDPVQVQFKSFKRSLRRARPFSRERLSAGFFQ